MQYNDAEAAMSKLENQGFSPVHIVSRGSGAADRDYDVEVPTGSLPATAVSDLNVVAADSPGDLSIHSTSDGLLARIG
jgi:hypothetical protein